MKNTAAAGLWELEFFDRYAGFPQARAIRNLFPEKDHAAGVRVFPPCLAIGHSSSNLNVVLRLNPLLRLVDNQWPGKE